MQLFGAKSLNGREEMTPGHKWGVWCLAVTWMNPALRGKEGCKDIYSGTFSLNWEDKEIIFLLFSTFQ